MKVDILEVAGFSIAIKAMRNAKNSWDRSDSYTNPSGTFILGEADTKLCQTLIKAGGEHRKFLRQIHVWLELDLPRYIWQELDTYKFNTKNSCSTMHKLFHKEIVKSDFILCEEDMDIAELVILRLNKLRLGWLASKEHRDVKTANRCLVRAKRLLFESFLQFRTMDTSYEELRSIYHQREHHLLKEDWGVVLRAIEQLPYFEELINYTGRGDN